MNIYDTLTRAFGPKAAKSPTVPALEKLLADTEKAVDAARARLNGLEGQRADMIFAGEEARLAHRSAIGTARDDLMDAETALFAVRDRLETARLEAAEKGKREAYARAQAAQRAAADAVLADYTPAREALLRLQRLVAEADELVVAVNRDLPAGAEPLEREAEALVRDIPGTAEAVVAAGVVKRWVGEGGAPVDEAVVQTRDGRTGYITVETGFGSHAAPVHLVTFERRVVRPWRAPVYGARLADLEIPPLRPDAPPAVQEVEDFRIVPPALAAE
ncbi:MAG: hypothetical protein J0I31_12160 [Rhizobiales bacterium]|uniref:hypothetical protein n=1 Tax=Xanthobacter sp. TaxID=35809 RepID=UPI001AD35B59|nr:hypothetical protein [Xanthobacter sp.]MBN8916339.1 hypothetical protein [Hyphomicrobiales bacterium]